MRYAFGGYVLDTEQYRLERQGEGVRLPPRVYQMLVYLLEQRHRVVSRQELFEQVWPDQYVSDAALERCIKQVRQAVGDSGRRQHIIETVHGHGYRFIAEVCDVAAAASAFSSTVPVPSAPAEVLLPEPERRQLTVLSCTLAESDVLTQRLDADDLHEVLCAFHTLGTEISRQYGGYVAQRTEDSFLLYFGYPKAHDDDGRRAVLAGLFSFHGVRGELQMAQELAEQQLRLAQRQQDEFLRFMAHVRMGFALYFRGELTQGRLNFEQAMALYDPPQHSAQARLVGAADLVVLCLSHLAYSLIVLGYPNQAMTRIHEALSRAQELAHPYSSVYALVHAIHIDELRQEVHAVYKQADAMIAICEEQAFAFWLPIGRFFQGWAMVIQGHGEAGVDQMRQCIPPSERLMAQYFHGRLAEAYVTIGQIETGWDLITTALDEVNQGAGRFYIAELHRLQGELLLQLSANFTEAESCFHQAISIARAQHAKFWELRAVISLARLWQSQGKCQDAYDLLAPVYAWFTEGFDTADLQDAKTLLEELID